MSRYRKGYLTGIDNAKGQNKSPSVRMGYSEGSGRGINNRCPRIVFYNNAGVGVLHRCHPPI